MSIYYIVSLRIVYYRYANRPERFEFFADFGGGKVAEVDFWCFLCYNRNKFSLHFICERAVKLF